MARDTQQEPSFADRLCAATNSHDVDRVVGCFAEDYRNETPAHPARGFTGHEQVRRSWTQIFAGVPDLIAQVVRSDQHGDTCWSEWEMRGTRVDGGAHLMRGVVVFTLAGGRAAAARFYLEPVDHAAVDADEAVRRVLTEERR